jgi:hypothetical protein
MAPKHGKSRESSRTYRERLTAALADFTPPSLDEMLEESNRLFKPERRRRAEGTRRRVGIVPQDDPEGGHSFNLTVPALLAEMVRLTPRKPSDRKWSFVLGGTRNYIFFNSSGPGVFSGGYPVWRGRKFAGCMMFSLRRKDVRRVLHNFYAGRSMSDCFPKHGGELNAY